MTIVFKLYTKKAKVM